MYFFLCHFVIINFIGTGWFEMRILYLSIFIIVFSSCSLFDKACVYNKSNKIIFFDRLPERLMNKLENIAYLTCVLEKEPQNNRELLDNCHNQFRDEAIKKGGSIIVVDPREIRSIGGKTCFLQHSIGPVECPENIYMYGTLYRYK
jgi:hypothetical protein